MRPVSPDLGFARPADLAACREMIRGGSRSFFTASLLLPEQMREGAYALYGFCRLSDDAVDLAADRPRARDALARLRERLDRAYAGNPADAPADRAFADAVRRFAIPRAAPEALLDGFGWDTEDRLYETPSDVLAYGARVAGTVGIMMAALMGARTPAHGARACDLGIAMQLTNIARDVGEDARRGRVYLPQAWLAEEGLSREALIADPRFDPRIGRVIARLLNLADGLYARAGAGIAALPAPCRPGIEAARRIYAEIGTAVRRAGCDSVSARARVGGGRKLVLMLRAQMVLPRRDAAAFNAPALPEAQFLVDALSASAAAAPDLSPPPWWRLGTRLAWVADLFAEIETRRRLGRTGF